MFGGRELSKIVNGYHANVSLAPPPMSKAELQEMENEATSVIQKTLVGAILLYLCKEYHLAIRMPCI